MGQQQCGSPSQTFEEDYFRGTLVSTFGADEMSITSYCKSMGVGKYMDGKSTKKVAKMWEDLIRQTGIDVKQNSKGYQSSLSSPEDRDFYIEVQQKYRFVCSRPDTAVLMLYVMDGKGLSHLLRLGVPHPVRWSTWKTFLLAKNHQFVKPVLFETMINKECDSLVCIEKDVMRTLISHHFFKDNSQGFGQAQLMRVLIAIANYVPVLGYCQGMNFVVGFLLMISGCDESLTFSCMISLLLDPRYLLYYYYCEGLPLFLMVQHMIVQLIARHFPKLDLHLKKTETPESFWITKMLLSIFLYVVNMNDCMRLWDYFIARGSVKGYLELICGLIESIHEQMMRCDNLEISQLFSGSSKSELRFDVNQVIYRAQTKYRLKKSHIVSMVKEYLSQKPSQGFEEIFLQYNNKPLFIERIQQWSKEHAK